MKVKHVDCYQLACSPGAKLCVSQQAPYRYTDMRPNWWGLRLPACNVFFSSSHVACVSQQASKKYTGIKVDLVETLTYCLVYFSFWINPIICSHLMKNTNVYTGVSLCSHSPTVWAVRCGSYPLLDSMQRQRPKIDSFYSGQGWFSDCSKMVQRKCQNIWWHHVNVSPPSGHSVGCGLQRLSVIFIERVVCVKRWERNLKNSDWDFMCLYTAHIQVCICWGVKPTKANQEFNKFSPILWRSLAFGCFSPRWKGPSLG